MFDQAITSQIIMPWNRSFQNFCTINLKFAENMPRVALEVRKSQDPSSSRYGDIKKNPRGGKNTPLPLIGLTFALLGGV